MMRFVFMIISYDKRPIFKIAGKSAYMPRKQYAILVSFYGHIKVTVNITN